jgi:hypothetical protein
MREARLRAWLLPSQPAVTEAELRAMLGLSASDLAVESRDAITFSLAILRDIYPDDGDVRRWLAAPRHGFGGTTAIELFRRGLHATVTAALVNAWHQSWRSEWQDDTIDCPFTLAS